MKDDGIYLAHILESIRRIEEDTTGGEAQFYQKRVLQDAVLRNLQTMAESTQRLSPALKATQPQIEWQSIAAFRNILVHDYLGIDIRLIWQVTQRDIPELKQAVLAMQSGLEQ